LLRDFENCSGLSINIGKTQLMVVGTNEWEVDDEVLGIKMVESVKILGITLNRTLDKLNDNWDKAIIKMERLARYWGTFGMSITGRVMVAKTFLMAQVIYFMGIMPLSNEHGVRINEIMLNFVRGSDRLIERRWQLLCAKLGGYGLVDANIMNICVKASWMDRWKREAESPDMLSMIVWNGNFGMETWKINSKSVVNTGLPIMEDILKSWIVFKKRFYEVGSNIFMAEVLDNEAISDDGEDIGETIFTRNRYVVIKEDLAGIRLEQICGDDGTIKGKVEIERNIRIEITWAEYFRMRAEVLRITQRYFLEREAVLKRMSLDELVTGRRKGCKRYRSIMTGKWSREYIDNSPCTIAAGVTLWGENMGGMTRKLVESNYNLWTTQCLSYEFKNFLFRMVHGKLYLNNQRAHFMDAEPMCTFCGITEKKRLHFEGIRPDSNEYARRLARLDRETSNHLFWECRVVRESINKVLNRICQTTGRAVDKKKYMGGWDIEGKLELETILMILHTIKFGLYKCKIRHVLPTFTGLWYEIEEFTKSLSKRRKWVETVRDLSGIMRKVLVDE
jgi:hypothetical protein